MKTFLFVLLIFFQSLSFAHDITIKLDESNIRAVINDLADLEAMVPIDPRSNYGLLMKSYFIIKAKTEYDPVSLSLGINSDIMKNNLEKGYFDSSCKEVKVNEDMTMETNCILQIGSILLKGVTVTISNNRAHYEYSKEDFKKITYEVVATSKE